MGIVSDVYDVLRERTREANQVREELTAVEEKIDSEKYSKLGVSELQLERNALKQKINGICNSALIESNKIVSDYQEQLRNEDCLNPSELTDDVRLLSAGIPLLPRDVKAILERNKNNRTMTQLALRYAKEHDLDIGAQYIGNQEKIEAAEGVNYAANVYTSHWMKTDMAEEMLDKLFEAVQ